VQGIENITQQGSSTRIPSPALFPEEKYPDDACRILFLCFFPDSRASEFVIIGLLRHNRRRIR